jgi:hypothetical protein
MTASRTRARATAVDLYRAEVARLEDERQATILKARAIYKEVRRKAWERFARGRDAAWRRIQEPGAAETSDTRELLVAWDEFEKEGSP